MEILKGQFHIYPKDYPLAHCIDARGAKSIRALQDVLGPPGAKHGPLLYYGLGTSAKVLKPEEKRSDVNLAVHLLNDAWMGRYEAALVISNDSDLVEAVRVVKFERKKEVIVANPFSERGIPLPKVLAKLKVAKRRIRSGTLGKCLLPDPIPNTKPPITKPSAW